MGPVQGCFGSTRNAREPVGIGPVDGLPACSDRGSHNLRPLVSAGEVSAADQSASSITIGGGDWDNGEGGVNGIAGDTTNAAIVVNGNDQQAASFPAVGDKVLIVGADGSAPTSAPADESDRPQPDANACCREGPGPNAALPGITGLGGGRIGALVLSPYVKGNTWSATSYNHYSLLASIEDVFKLPYLGYAQTKGLNRFGLDVYNSGWNK